MQNAIITVAAIIAIVAGSLYIAGHVSCGDAIWVKGCILK